MLSFEPHAVPADPRDQITPDAVQVAPRLLGTPLARPWRRGAAMLVDALLVAILSNAPGFLLAAAAALALFRASAKSVAGGFLRRSTRLFFRASAALALFVALVSGSRAVAAWLDDDEPRTPVVAEAGEDGGLESGGVQQGVAGLRAAAEVLSFQRADDPAEARRAAEALVVQFRRAGMDEEDIQEMLDELAVDRDRPWLAAAVDSVLGASPPAPAEAPDADSLATAYAAALRAGDAARAEELRRALVPVLAADTLQALADEVRRERRARAETSRRLDEAEDEMERLGVVALARSIMDDLGLGLGWTSLYFTAFLALWRGRTPGKRLLGLRVIRLDARPIGWWNAFERFGGYAAGLATGLLGFMQIFWDDNRQAVQDRIAGTVVIRDPSA